jgi:hypothetical protein
MKNSIDEDALDSSTTTVDLSYSNQQLPEEHIEGKNTISSGSNLDTEEEDTDLTKLFR